VSHATGAHESGPEVDVDASILPRSSHEDVSDGDDSFEARREAAVKAFMGEFGACLSSETFDKEQGPRATASAVRTAPLQATSSSRSSSQASGGLNLPAAAGAGPPQHSDRTAANARTQAEVPRSRLQHGATASTAQRTVRSQSSGTQSRAAVGSVAQSSPATGVSTSMPKDLVYVET
jgi:hypothetical protein